MCCRIAETMPAEVEETTYQLAPKRPFFFLYRFNDQNIVRTHHIPRTSKTKIFRRMDMWGRNNVARGCSPNIFQGGIATLSQCFQGRNGHLTAMFSEPACCVTATLSGCACYVGAKVFGVGLLHSCYVF